MQREVQGKRRQQKLVDPINPKDKPGGGKTASSLNVQIHWHHQTNVPVSFFSINTEKSRKNWVDQLRRYQGKEGNPLRYMRFVMSPPGEVTDQVLYFRTYEKDEKISGEREGMLNQKKVTFVFDIPAGAEKLEQELSQWTIVPRTRSTAPPMAPPMG